MKRNIYLLLILLQIPILTVYANGVEEPEYSVISIEEIKPAGGGEITTSGYVCDIYISFTGSVTIDEQKSHINIVGVEDNAAFQNITAANANKSLWYLPITRDVFGRATGEIKLIIYAYDNNGHAVKGNKGEYSEITYKCYMGIPDITVSPTGGYADNLKEFVFSYDKGIKVNNDSESKIVLYGNDKSTVIHEFTGEDITEVEDDACRLIAALSDIVSATGTYWLYIPDGFFLLGETGIKNKYTWTEYTIEDPSHKYGVTLDPLNGSEVKSLSKLKITFDNWNYAIPYYRNRKSISIIDENGNTMTVGKASVEENRNKVNQCVITLNTPITTPGKYKLYIPEYAFILDESTNFHSEEMYFDYIITGEPDLAEDVTISPAEGDVETLEQITLNFNSVSFVGTTNEANATLTNMDNMEIVNGAVKNGTFYTQLIVILEHKVTAPGTYELRIPAGSIQLMNDIYDKDLVYSFRIQGTTNIDFLSSPNKEIDNDTIYDMTGRRLESITNHGIYIVNGKKYIK